MIGVVLALIWFCLLYFLQGEPLIPTYQSATSFLFYWYVVSGILDGVFYLIIAALVSLGFGLQGAKVGGVWGGVLGAIGGGGAVSLL
ncbi:hypothetical protein KBG31_03060, partial [Patescibacteria group bacterium]|nr:hypothetical protein [Patescibacteria group bacterium]